MTMTHHTPTARAASGRWLVTPEHNDVAGPLRDYFLRLGLDARMSPPRSVELVAHERDDHDLEAYLASWTSVNGIPATLRSLLRLDSSPTTQHDAKQRPRLGELLTANGMITDDQLAWGIAEARATNELLGVTLLRARLIFEDDLARTLSQQLSITYVNIGVVGVDASVVRLLPAEVGSAAAAIPIRWEGDAVLVGFADPTDPVALAAVAEHLPSFSLGVAELSEIKLAWRDLA